MANLSDDDYFTNPFQYMRSWQLNFAEDLKKLTTASMVPDVASIVKSMQELQVKMEDFTPDVSSLVSDMAKSGLLEVNAAASIYRQISGDELASGLASLSNASIEDAVEQITGRLARGIASMRVEEIQRLYDPSNAVRAILDNRDFLERLATYRVGFAAADNEDDRADLGEKVTEEIGDLADDPRFVAFVRQCFEFAAAQTFFIANVTQRTVTEVLRRPKVREYIAHLAAIPAVILAMKMYPTQAHNIGLLSGLVGIYIRDALEDVVGDFESSTETD